MVSYLTEELVKQGHEVTLFASGDSITSARLVATCDHALRLDKKCLDPLAHHMLMLEKLSKSISDFDIIHFHIDYLHFPISRALKLTQLTTMHGRLDLNDVIPLHREYREMPLISISDAQRTPIPWANWIATVYHGLSTTQFTLSDSTDNYLAFVGRVSPEKGVDRAIKIAQDAGIKLKIAAKIDKADREYFETIIRPLFETPIVEYIGEISDSEKQQFIGGAEALLFPINWPEPFGLVMIESLACGTPVIAYKAGSVPEIIENGKTGFVVESHQEALSAVKNIKQISRKVCRNSFETRFSVTRMATDYVKVYESLIKKNRY